MSIKNRIVDNLIACTQLDKNLVPGLDGKTSGSIEAQAGLKQIADNVAISTQMAKTNTSASHARPSMFAFVSSFAQNVEAVLNAVAPGKPAVEYMNLDAQVKQDFAEWQGLIAAVALNNIYSCVGLDLSIMMVQLKSNIQAHRCILWEMDKDAYYKTAITERDPVTGAPSAGLLFYICQKGTPFAIFHPLIGICPMQTYDDSMFDGVLPWHHTDLENCHKGWTSIAEPNQPPFLSDFCLSRIKWWANHNSLIPYSNYVPVTYTPDLSLVSGVTIPQATSIDLVWPGRGTSFGKSMMFYQSQVGKLPKLFLNNILITYAGAGNNRMKYNSAAGEQDICFAGNPAALAEYAPVPSFCSDLVKVLEACTLDNITILPELVGGNLNNILTKVDIRNQFGEVFTVQKLYDSAHLRQGRIPYMMIWPYVDMPANMNLWKEYYATWDNSDESLIMLTNADGGEIDVISDMTYTFPAPVNSHNICCPTRQTEGWTVCTSDDPFRHATLLGKVEGGNSLSEMGLIFMPAYKTYPAAPGSATLVINNPVKVAIDFGTTSTVCAISVNKGSVQPLEFLDYGRTVTCENEQSKKNLDVFHWLGNPEGGSGWSWKQKFFSIAQLFDRVEVGGGHHALHAAGQQDYYVDARMCMLSGSAMSNYAAGARDNTDPLRSQGIMNDMKFNDTLDVLNYHAASAFLAGVYSYVVLNLLHNRIVPSVGDYLELRVSYPNDVTLSALKKSWLFAHSIVARMMGKELSDPVHNLVTSGKYYSEAAATTAYQKTIPALATKKGLVSVDIGGGTTDISITDVNHPGDVRTLSLRYAGREMMVSSLIEYFRRFQSAPDAQDDAVKQLQLLFGPLWNTDDLSLQTQFLNRCKDKTDMFGLKGLTADSTLRMYIELLLSDGMTLQGTAVEFGTDLLRQLIALKFIMLMRLTARAVRENFDLWYNGGVLVPFNNKVDINLAVSGTSAQLLQYVFECTLGNLTNLTESSAPTMQAQQCMKMFSQMFTDELKDKLPENVKTNLAICIDPNVKEKREVAYGMLQPNVDNVQAQADAATAEAAAAAMATWAGMDFDGLDDDAIRNEKTDRMANILCNYPAEGLCKFVEGERDAENKPIVLGLRDYIARYEKIYYPGAVQGNRGLGDNIKSISNLLSDYLQYFPASQMAVSQTRAKYMVEDEQAEYLDLLACIYMVEDILDMEMADLQSK